LHRPKTRMPRMPYSKCMSLRGIMNRCST
jgi:hypothetical protein